MHTAFKRYRITDIQTDATKTILMPLRRW